MTTRLASMGLVVLGLASIAARPDDNGTPLFNGKDLSGWTAVLQDEGADPKATWSVADGVLHCTGKPAGYIRTDKPYRDYKLTLVVVPDSGTGELAGIGGRMSITITDGKHFYDFEYTLPEKP